MTSFPTTLNNREIVYSNISTDFSEISHFPSKNWLLVAIADKEQVSLLPRFAELCVERNVLYVCGAGGAASEIDDEFDIVSVNRAIEAGKNFDDQTFEDTPLTTWHASFEEALWFGITAASHETLPIAKVIVANLTDRDYKELVGEIIMQIHSGWLPPD